MEWYVGVLKKYADFSGRARRTEYWMFVLFNVIFSLAARFIDYILDLDVGPFGLLYSLAVLVPSIAVAVRRLHDVGKSGWWYFIVFVPLIGWIWLLVLLLTDSQPGENQYGPNPKGVVQYETAREAAPSLQMSALSGGGKKGFQEADNRGTRYEHKDQAVAYWFSRTSSQKFDPFVMYNFKNEGDARNALLALDYIHEAVDSKKLISTETLQFGYYLWPDSGDYEAFVCGEDLTHEMWQQAKDAFEKHGGTRKNDQEPEKVAKKAAPQKSGEIDKVKFVREDRKPSQISGQNYIYRIYSAPDAASANAFLKQNPVNQRLLYLVVETPEGNYCRDIEGMYKE